MPYYIQWEVDWRSLAYTLAIATATAVLFGLFPALQATRGNLHESLKEGTRGNSVSRSLLRSSLVVVQISLALVALVGALLFVRSFRESRRLPAGLRSQAADDDARSICRATSTRLGTPRRSACRTSSDAIEALPGVQAAFASNMIPISGGGGGGRRR